MPENFLLEKDGPISTITFNRPERRNCMTREVMLEFEEPDPSACATSTRRAC